MDADKFWSRVNSYLTASLNQAWLCRKIGVPESTLSSAIKRQAWPRADVAAKIADVLGVNLYTLITGDEQTVSEEEEDISEKVISMHTPTGIVSTTDEEPTFLVPIVPQKLSAGHGEDFLSSSTEYVGHVRILERMARGLDTSRLIAAVVKGDSMTGVQIFSGDVVVFARGYLDENGLYVVSLRGEVLVKRLEFDRIHEQLAIISENKNYRPITVDAHDDGINILGKVVGWVHCHPY
ncbi:MAG: XRE family transcriptional regulator [Clostridia bacterium]